MENKLEQLLNSLVKAGWKPRGYELDGIRVFPDRKIVTYMSSKGSIYRKYRELVSKESGLWQFVCENDLIDNPAECWYWRNHFELDEIEYNQTDFQYWVLESSLKDENELEEFLLSNIVIKDEKK